MDGRCPARFAPRDAGSRITLDLAGDGLSSLRIDEAALQAQVASGGALLADGGAVLLTARAIEELASGSINASGVVRARSLVERDGRIVLDAGTGPGGGTTLTASPLEKFYVVIDGELEITAVVDGRTEVRTLGPLDSCRIAPGEGRQLSNRSDRPAAVLLVMPETR